MLLFLTVNFVSCSSNTPQFVAQNYLENLSKGKLTEAKKYATEQTGNFIDLSIWGGSDFDFLMHHK